MKSFLITGPAGLSDLQLVERPTPSPRRHEVVLRMLAASINYRDLEICRGTFHTTFALPLIPLSDGVGEVVAIGEDVRRVKVGDRVCTAYWARWVGGGIHMSEVGTQRGGPIDGSAAEFIRIDEQACVHAPKHLTHLEAATLPCAAVTAYQALVPEGNLHAGDTVLVQGTGGVSIFALQFAVAAGAKVFVTSSSDAKLAKAKALGAAACINYRTTPEWSAPVLELTDGKGVDQVIEVGGPTTFAQSLKAVRRGGWIHVVGYLGGNDGLINPLDIFRRQAKVRGSAVGSRETFEAMNRSMEVNANRPQVDKVFPWTELKAAFAYLESGAHFGKIALHIAD